MRVWSFLLLVALLLPCCWAQEQEPEEATDAPAVKQFPRSRLRPKLHRPTSAAPIPVEGEAEAPAEVVEEKEEAATIPTTAKPRPRSRGRTNKLTPSVQKEEDEARESSTPSAAPSTRRPKNRSRSRSRNRSKTTSVAPPTEGTTAKSSKRRGSGRRTTKATTEIPITSSARSSSRSRSRNRSNSRSRSTTKTPTTLVSEEQTQRSKSRNRSKSSNSKSQRRTTTKKPTTVTTVLTTTLPPATTTLRTTPLEETEFKNIPPIPVQRNPELLAPDVVKPEEKFMQQDNMDKLPKLMPNEEMIDEKGIPASVRKIMEPPLPQNENPSLSSRKPVRPLPVEGLIVEEPVELSEGVMREKPVKTPPMLDDKAPIATPLITGTRSRSNLDPFPARPEFEGVPPKIVGPVDSRDLLNSKPPLGSFPEEKVPPKTVPALSSKVNLPDSEDDSERDFRDEPQPKSPIQNESVERKGLLAPERSEGVPPKPIELVPFHSPAKKTDELPPKSKINLKEEALPESPRRFAFDDEEPKLPPRRQLTQPEDDPAIWSFDPTIRPNLISSPPPLRGSNRKTTIPDLPTTSRSKSINKDSDSRASSNSRSSTGRVTPFPIRFETVSKDDGKETVDKTRQNTVSPRIPASRLENVPNPFEEDEEEEEEDEVPFQRSSSNLKVKSRTESPLPIENSRNRLRSIPSKETDRLRANQLPLTTLVDIAPPTTTMRIRTTTVHEIITKGDDVVAKDMPKDTKRIQDRIDIITEDNQPRIISKETAGQESGGEGFIPLQVKLSFEEESEEDEKITPKPAFEVPPRSHLLAIENSPPRTANAPKSKSSQRQKVSVDDDPLLVPPAEIRKSPSKKEDELESSVKSKSQKVTTTSWSKPVIEEDFTTTRFKSVTTERAFISSSGKERQFSPRISEEESEPKTNAKTNSRTSSKTFNPSGTDSRGASGLPSQTSSRDRVTGFETDTVSSRAKKPELLPESDKVVSDRGQETVSQFESPSFVIRKPVNYASPPPRNPPKNPEPPSVDAEPIESVASFQSAANVKDKMPRPASPSESLPPAKSTSFDEQRADQRSISQDKSVMPEVAPTRQPPKIVTTEATDEYEEYYDDEVITGA